MPHEGEQPGAPLRSALMQYEETDTEVEKKGEKKKGMKPRLIYTCATRCVKLMLCVTFINAMT